MVSVEEIKRLAVAIGVDPPVADHDYVLGCYLHFLSVQPEAKAAWIFKGGTSLRKCYFEGYRFSEDLDFTARRRLVMNEVRHILHAASVAMQNKTGIRTSEIDLVVEVVNDDYGKEAYEAKVYYRGPWNYGGTPAALKVHLNRDERLVFPLKELPVMHEYSDEGSLPAATLHVYALEEILAEKLRAFSGQRKHAIARDVYDIYHLSKTKTDVQKAIGAFPEKCRAKGIIPAEIVFDKIVKRQAEYEANWRTNLEYLIPATMKVEFAEAWKTSLELLKKAMSQ